jgi:hypothetical protein
MDLSQLISTPLNETEAKNGTAFVSVFMNFLRPSL